MFERFTDRARQVVVLAQEEGMRLNHNYIGTEHILLGLIREGEGIGARALQGLDVSLEAARSEVEEIIGRGRVAPTGHITFTPRVKKVFELSLREALQLGHSHIGTEHILLGLIREGEGVAAQVLVKLGAGQERMREAVTGLLGEPPPKGRRKGVRRRLPVESRPIEIPHCPTCGRDLASHASHRRMTLRNDEDEEIEVLVVYCRGCGRTLGTSPA